MDCINKKKVCLIGINFYPEQTAIGLYSTQLSRYLVKNDWDVSVITGFPYYPEWKISKEYKIKPNFYQERIDDVDIYRYKQYVPEKPNFKTRILHLIDFTLGSLINVFKVKKCDIVICVVPFTSTVFLGWILAKLRGAKLSVHIQDFEVDAIIESGLSNNNGSVKKILFKFLYLIEEFLFNRADMLSTISNGMLLKLKDKTVKDTCYFPNWVSGDDINPNLSVIHPLFTEYGEKFKILYSGNVGEKQDWEFFLNIVEYFADYNGIQFFVVGQGAKYTEINKKLSNYKNVIVREPVAFEELNDLLCSADLHVLFQKKDIVDTVMPSKILGMMASAVPSLVTGNLKSEVSQVFNESQKDGFYESGELDSCVDYILKLNGSKIEQKDIGSKAREYILNNFDANAVLNSFNEKLNLLLLKNQ